MTLHISNDRLVLGLKGTMSEAELHVLRARLRGGILNKALKEEVHNESGSAAAPISSLVLPAADGAAATAFSLIETCKLNNVEILVLL